MGEPARQLLATPRASSWWAWRDAGITSAFPQLDVRFGPPVEKALCTLVIHLAA